jgi:hypothetical protein
MNCKIFTILLLSVIYNYGIAQVKGPERIVGTYTGEKNKELAQGKGKSVGKDTFEGEFKKGFPVKGVYIFGEDVEIEGTKYVKGEIYEGEFSDGVFDGKGKLTFQDNSKPAVEGYWKKGKYAGKTKLGYEVLKKTNISRVVVQRSGSAPNKISVQGLTDIVETGKRNAEFVGKEMDDSNKTPKAIEVYSDLGESKFPFVLNLKGTVPSDGSKAELQVLIENPGYWIITVYTN